MYPPTAQLSIFTLSLTLTMGPSRAAAIEVGRRGVLGIGLSTLLGRTGAVDVVTRIASPEAPRVARASAPLLRLRATDLNALLTQSKVRVGARGMFGFDDLQVAVIEDWIAHHPADAQSMRVDLDRHQHLRNQLMRSGYMYSQPRSSEGPPDPGQDERDERNRLAERIRLRVQGSRWEGLDWKNAFMDRIVAAEEDLARQWGLDIGEMYEFTRHVIAGPSWYESSCPSLVRYIGGDDFDEDRPPVYSDAQIVEYAEVMGNIVPLLRTKILERNRGEWIAHEDFRRLITESTGVAEYREEPSFGLKFLTLGMQSSDFREGVASLDDTAAEYVRLMQHFARYKRRLSLLAPSELRSSLERTLDRLVGELKHELRTLPQRLEVARTILAEGKPPYWHRVPYDGIKSAADPIAAAHWASALHGLLNAAIARRADMIDLVGDVLNETTCAMALGETMPESTESAPARIEHLTSVDLDLGREDERVAQPAVEVDSTAPERE